MITALHALIYADDAEKARAFCRDVLGFHFMDEGGGWLIFKTGPSELGVHPTNSDDPSWHTEQKHEISFICDDLEATVAELRTKGAEFNGEIQNETFGLTINLQIPGGPEVMLYQAHYDPPAFAE